MENHEILLVDQQERQEEVQRINPHSSIYDSSWKPPQASLPHVHVRRASSGKIMYVRVQDVACLFWHEHICP